MFEDEEVRPDGLTVRRLRRQRGWSQRALVEAIERASLASTGLPSTITPNLLSGIEERNERVPYETLCLLSGGLDCDPIDLLMADDEEGDEEDEERVRG